MNNLLDRFLHYVSFDTTSKRGVKTAPTSESQWVLVKELEKEMKDLGFKDVYVTEHCCVMGTWPSTVDWEVPTIGFLAHMDTSPDCSGKNIKPQIIENYRGGDIALGNGDEILSPVRFPMLHDLIGHTLITTDGTTLLGADDKAGIAQIMTAMVRLRESGAKHGDIRVAFTPDEEVGRGTAYFDVAAFNAKWAYTVDGGGIGELECENFNAATAIVKISGNNVHPGMSKNVMVNALGLATKFNEMLPALEKPEHTEHYEGFYHLNNLKGNVASAEMTYIIRDFDRENFEARKQNMRNIGEQLNKTLPKECLVDVQIEDAYYNMREKVAEHPHIVDIAKQAIRDVGLTPIEKPIRGGTDGARLSFMGLPCPNLFTGGYNYHGKHEFVSLNTMEQATATIMRIAELTAEQAK